MILLKKGHIGVFFSSIGLMLLLFLTATTQHMATMAQLPTPENDYCGYICESQRDFSETMNEAREKIEAEQTAEQFGGEENVPTVDEFLDEVEAEGDFDDEREAEEMEAVNEFLSAGALEV